MNRVVLILGVLLVVVFGCREKSANDLMIHIPSPVKTDIGPFTNDMSSEQYHDKILGALVGSAIGDAMGASTEMWNRVDIQNKYGYIRGLTPAVREQSPEGTWRHNMPSGATTDDTRWKYLVGKYVTKHIDDLNPSNFAQFIRDYYQSEIDGLSKEEMLQSTDILDEKIEKINWIKEWVRVVIGWQKGNEEYQKTLNRFYGGEMACAGILYTPVLGLVTDNPESSYTVAFDHALFDLGYAKDISGIVAAMTNTAMLTSDIDSILQTITFVDPYEYKNSRLVGRLADVIAQESETFIQNSFGFADRDTTIVSVPAHFSGDLYEWKRQVYIYDQLNDRKKSIAFHAGEIWQIMYAALVFGEGDYLKTMQFIVNYGRDNDTVAAAAGMILGAKDGYKKLPQSLKTQVVQVSRDVIGIDLNALAYEISSLSVEEPD